ncbi:MAG: BlaI/MecI/CopY family transcriptional regulator [Bacteroidota bacterium]
MEERSPNKSELEILQVLWDKGALTAREVHDTLSEEKTVRYTTTLKTMQIMHQRAFIGRKASGQTHVYHALMLQNDTESVLLDNFLKRTFGGSALNMVMKALGNYDASSEELEEIKKMIEQKSALKNKKGDGESIV